MTIISVFLLCLAILFVNASLLIFVILYRTKKMAVKSYQSIKSLYGYLLHARRRYFEAHSIEDEKERKRTEVFWKEIYNLCLEELENYETELIIKFLSKEQREDLEHTLALPRYELI